MVYDLKPGNTNICAPGCFGVWEQYLWNLYSEQPFYCKFFSDKNIVYSYFSYIIKSHSIYKRPVVRLGVHHVTPGGGEVMDG